MRAFYTYVFLIAATASACATGEGEAVEHEPGSVEASELAIERGPWQMHHYGLGTTTADPFNVRILISADYEGVPDGEIVAVINYVFENRGTTTAWVHGWLGVSCFDEEHNVIDGVDHVLRPGQSTEQQYRCNRFNHADIEFGLDN